jgi:DNA-binding SARP family transcriptional activator/pimeloyl-ACP methyl ester carboxylesterase
MTATEGVGARLYLLGRFELRIDGQVAIGRSWPRAKPAALLKLLALEVRRSLPRDQVLEALWPGVEPNAAANNLYKTLHHLRTATRTTARDAIVAIDRGSVSLRSDVWIDVHAFVDGCIAARDAESPEAMSAALDLYRGPLLPDDPYAPWTEPHRENVRSLFISSSMALAIWLDRAGAGVAAMERANAAVQADPTIAQAQRMLMRMYARAGNPTLALRQYEQFCAVLRRELDVEPDEKTRRVRDAILAALNEPPTGEPDAAPFSGPQVHLARRTPDADGIAWCGYGTGGGTPLIAMPWLPHSDIVREAAVPEWRAFYEGLGEGRRVVRYDSAGLGASRPGRADFSVEAQQAEIDAVAAAADVERFALLAAFHSSIAAVTYAVAQPERVSHLILWCGYARGADLRPRDELSSLRRLLGADWRVYSESAAQFFFGWEHQRIARGYAELIRESSTPEIARQFVLTAAEYDVTDLLPRIQAPTLVMHRPAMPWLDACFSHELAERIPNARLALLDGAASAPFVEGGGEVERLIDEFIDGHGCCAAQPSQAACCAAQGAL